MVGLGVKNKKKQTNAVGTVSKRTISTRHLTMDKKLLLIFLHFNTGKYKARGQGYKTFSMLNSSEQIIYPAHKCLNVGILTFISMINTTSEIFKARNFIICRYFSFYMNS